jgi:hypothetical protein
MDSELSNSLEAIAYLLYLIRKSLHNPSAASMYAGLAEIAGWTERHESVDRCTTLELGFNRERAVQDLQPLIHAD